MLRHQLLLIYRTFKKYKTSFFINLAGLSAGLACALLIYLWVNDEIQKDKFQDSSIYQVMVNEITSQGIHTSADQSALTAGGLKLAMPEVEDAVTASPTYWLAQTKIVYGQAAGVKAAGKFADPNFFSFFNYPVITGNTDQVLKNPNGIVLSEDLARKIFGSLDIIGKEVIWRNPEMKNETKVQVSGVFKNITADASDHFDFVLPIEALFTSAPIYKEWNNYGPSTFVSLREGTNIDSFNAKIKDFLASKGVKFRKMFVRKFSDAYLYDKYENGKQHGGRIDDVRIFSLLAVFILFIACVNFMNLSTARASRRMKELGVKKVMGASRSALIYQFLAESLLLTLISMFVALVLAELFLPQFNQITDKSLRLVFDLPLLLILATITLFTGLLAGSYPAFYLSGFNASTALKGKLQFSSSAIWTRRGLVIFQFTLSVILIVVVLVVYKQIEFLQDHKLGYQKDNVIYFEAEGHVKNNVVNFLTQVRKVPGVSQASGMDRDFLGEFGSTTGDFDWENRDPGVVIKFQNAGINDRLIETLGMQMVAGRSFSAQYGSQENKILINEAGIKAMGLKNPVGKIFRLWGKDYEIAGIVKNFNFESLQLEVKPVFFRYEATGSNRIFVRLEAGQQRKTIQALKDFYQTYNPGYVLDYRFLDQDFQNQYVAENRISVLSRYFAGLALIISCLGLFGLAAFTAERKMKEIGVRKVLGANEWNIVYLLSGEFMRPVLIAVVTAIPVSYLLTRYWLNSFAYRIELQWWFFVAAGLAAVAISWLTVGMQAVKSAHLSPVKCLRDE